MREKDFPILDTGVVYFDNGATTLKPNEVIESINNYYKKYSANIHRGEYYMSFKASDEYEYTREIVKNFINANSKEEIVFTSGTTEGINLVVNGFFERFLKQGDEVLLTKSEHASNIMPWQMLAMKRGIVLKYIPLDEDYKINIYTLKKMINKNTKVISIAGVTNVIGDVRDIKSISKIARNNKIYTLIDGAQMVPHMKVDVKYLDIDFLVFSGHKMCGPTGVGVLYGRYDLLNKIMPQKVGGGMNESYKEGSIYFKKVPERLEAGTPNIAGVIGLKSAILYLEKMGMSNIEKYEKDLRKYLISELNKIPYVQIYNESSESGIVIINVNFKNTSDLALYLNKHNICVRAGNHCTKMLKDELGIDNTVRISLYFYNTKNDVDYLIKALKDKEAILSF